MSRLLTVLARAVPTGSDPETVDAYYDHLFRTYIETMPVEQWEIQWTGPPLQASTVLIGFVTWLWVFSYYFNSVHREGQELYGVVSFGGAILERNGRVATFSTATWGGVVLWALYYLVLHAMRGQIY